MTIEPGSEWLHIESLTVVTVRDDYESSMFVGASIMGCGVSLYRGDFLRGELVPNVPVTPELLEGMGWGSRAKNNWRFCTLWLDKTDVTLWWLDETPDYCTVSQEGGDSIYVPFPATLRDLLTLLRVLGVAYTIPEPVARDCKDPKACQRCHGTGAVYKQAMTYSYYARCPKCLGTGKPPATDPPRKN